nr:MAG: hypothetical protein [Molluscum contagiosum virus]
MYIDPPFGRSHSLRRQRRPIFPPHLLLHDRKKQQEKTTRKSPL